MKLHLLSEASQQVVKNANCKRSIGVFHTPAQDPTSTDYQPPDEFFADAEEVVLHEGAVLYHPAGIWHHVECLGEACPGRSLLAE